nr:MAG TPA: hypothetical protein [Caudoviricetes sp.]
MSPHKPIGWKHMLLFRRLRKEYYKSHQKYKKT